MVVTYSESIPMGAQAPEFSLPGTDGNTYALGDFGDKDFLVVVFMCVHCPFVLPIEDKLIELQNKYSEAQFVAICSNDADTHPADSFDNMKDRAEMKSYPFPYLHDESQEVAKAYHAQCTPDIFVYDVNRELVYHGRIDDSGMEGNPTTNDLDEALALLTGGKDVDFEQVPSHGCNVKWRG